ncbi:uncharacterized protein AB675_1902 [Cyphellophora attinorum]|uniref:Uncharacterized protein n=1 Tax=Cyphellophora attinorum TaxID=1664694 RepID=A0A0N1HDV4_9EURO|nr:uncharacterized protein AB675_1902 [Phialophora attinorum]KPI42762.1 hypothetical protein AB675_1902 [Phialophora attinorum]
MTSWLHRLRTEIAPTQQPQTTTTPQTPLTPRAAARTRDPNTTRFNINQKCIYERRLPGGSFITAHIQRLQSGYYDSPLIHEDRIENVRLVAINFVFHPSRSHFRFKSAEISIALHRDGDEGRPDIAIPVSLRKLATDSQSSGSLRHEPRNVAGAYDSQALIHTPGTKAAGYQRQTQHSTPPRFLRHAPHLLFGAISPETLDWNFNLAGSLGVTQGPATASFNPSGGWKGSYKLYEMMRIQGSVRALHRWFDQTYDIEDGQVVWTLEENRLQKSGLPREFTFVLLLTKGSDDVADGLGHVKLDLDIKPVVSGFMGISNASFPSPLTKTLRYQPLHKDLVNLDVDVGQRFEPEISGQGFNFALLEDDFDQFVWLPGTTWSTKEGGTTKEEANGQTSSAIGAEKSPDGDRKGQGNAKLKPATVPPQLSLLGTADNTLNLRVILDSARGSPIPALPFSNLNLKTQPPYPSSRGPSPAVLAPTSITSSRPSQSDSKRRSITIVSEARPSGSHHSPQSPKLSSSGPGLDSTGDPLTDSAAAHL